MSRDFNKENCPSIARFWALIDRFQVTLACQIASTTHLVYEMYPPRWRVTLLTRLPLPNTRQDVTAIGCRKFAIILVSFGGLVSITSVAPSR
jgi:hypothetical protein